MKCEQAGCKKPRMKGSLRCLQHDPSPEAEAKRKALSARMVAARQAKRQQRLNAAQQPTDAPVTPAGWWESPEYDQRQRSAYYKLMLEAAGMAERLQHGDTARTLVWHVEQLAQVSEAWSR